MKTIWFILLTSPPYELLVTPQFDKNVLSFFLPTFISVVSIPLTFSWFVFLFILYEMSSSMHHLIVYMNLSLTILYVNCFREFMLLMPIHFAFTWNFSMWIQCKWKLVMDMWIERISVHLKNSHMRIQFRNTYVNWVHVEFMYDFQRFKKWRENHSSTHFFFNNISNRISMKTFHQICSPSIDVCSRERRRVCL